MSDKIKCLNEEQLNVLDKIYAEVLTGVPYPLQRVLDAVGDYEKIGKYKYKASCAMPEHPDNNPSMQIGYDATTKKVLLKCWSCGAKYEDLLPAMGLTPADLQIPILKGYQEEECCYDYCDEHGELLYQRVRYKNPKKFKCRRPNPDPNSKDKWIWNLNGARRVLYRLPELLSADKPKVYVTEGEKDVETLRKHGLIATTSGAAGSWKSEFGQHFRGRHVVVIPDRDEPGEQYANQIISDLFGIAASINKIKLPYGEDVSDYVKLGGKIQTLVHHSNQVPIQEASEYTGGPTVTYIDTVDLKEVLWLWQDRVPLGKLTLLAGEAGVGKSLLSLDIAARISTGTAWPDDRGAPDIGSTLIFGVEDDTNDTIAVRLAAAGAEPSKIAHVKNVFSMKELIKTVKKELKNKGDIRLVILDPISEFMGAADSYKNAEVRQVIAPLVDLAQKHNFAILAITHYAKTERQNASNKIIGSVAFVNVARMVWHVFEDGSRRLFVFGKGNITGKRSGLAYTVVETTIEYEDKQLSAVKIKFSPDPVYETAQEVLTRKYRKPSRVEIAEDFLESQLVGGPKEHKKIEKLALEQGITKHTLRRARENLNVVIKQEGQGKSRKSMWSLP